MKFVASLSFSDPTHFTELARTADECGWDYLGISDHVVYPEKLETPYPYSSDGKPMWTPSTPWPDPWVSIGAMAAVTSRLRFVTNIYVLPARNPFVVAKAVSTAAVLSGDRVVLGVGAGWMREEFELLGQDFGGRGRRTNEAMDVLRALFEGGMVEYHGEVYDFDRLEISPVPTAPVPIYVGGVSEPALRRVAERGDGWISALHTLDELRGLVARLRQLRQASARASEPFEVLAASSEASDVDGYRRMADLGVDGVMTMPWLLYGGDPEKLETKQEGLRRFAGDVIEKLR